MEATGRDDRLAEIVNNAEVFFSRDMRPRQAKLAPLAERIGPTVAEMTGCTPERDPRLVANWDAAQRLPEAPRALRPRRRRQAPPPGHCQRRVDRMNAGQGMSGARPAVSAGRYVPRRASGSCR